MKSRAEIKQAAKQILSNNYGTVLGNMILFALLSGLAGMTFIGGILVAPPLMVGLLDGIRLLWHGGNAIDLFAGFKEDRFGRSIGGIILMYVLIWLWSLLLIIPGIIMAFAYCMTPFIIADSKGLTAGQAIQLSKKITNGYKGDIFVFYLSFIGWFMLSTLTFHLLTIFYVGPYMLTAYAGLYEELKQNAIAKGVVTEDEFIA